MSTEILEMEARIKDHVSAQFDKMEGKIKHLGDTTTVNTKKMAVGFALMNQAVGLAVQGVQRGIGATKRYFEESIALSKEQIEVDAKLQQVLKSTAGAAGVTYEEMKKLASGLQEVTTYGDETTEGGIALLLTFTKIGKDIIPEATETMLNMATAMGTDLKTSAIQVGKALNDPIMGVSALRRVGVQLSDQQEQQVKDFIEVNDIASAQKIILGELETEFGGLARAVAQTPTGKIDQITNEISDMMEVLGDDLLPLVREWYELMSRISKITLPVLTNTAQGWAWLLGGEKEAKSKMDNLNYISSLQKDLLSLKSALEDAERTGENSFATISDSGVYLTHTIGSAKKEIEILTADLNKLMGSKPKTQKTTGGTTPGKPEATEDQLEARLKALEEEVAYEEDIAKQMLDIDTQLQKDKAVVYEQLKDQSIDFDQQIADAKSALRETEIYGLEDSLQKQYEMLDLEYQREKKLAEGNAIALAAIRDKYDLKREQALNEHNKAEKERQDTLMQNSVSNMETGANYTFSTLKQLASATKASSAVQKSLDIAQATANVYVGITKAIATERYWEIPFITALGFAQVANISAQKYASGGIVPGTSTSGDRIPALLNSREAIFTMEDQRALFDMIRRPQSVNNSQSVSLNISVGNGSSYDMAAAHYTVDKLVPVLGDALVRAKNEGRLRQYETLRR